MHVVIVLGSGITEFEERFVRAIASYARVRRVTVVRVAARGGVRARAERWRASVERAVARSRLRYVSPEALSARADVAADIHVVAVTASAVATQMAALDADLAVNLSGTSLAGAAHETYEVWWDGVLPRGFGVTSAPGDPPRNIVIARTLGASHEREVVERSSLTRTPGNESSDRRNAASRTLALLFRVLSRRLTSTAPLPSLVAETSVTDAEFGAPSGSAAGGVVRAVGAAAASVLSAVGRRASRPFWRIDAWELRYRTNAADFVVNSAAGTSSAGFRRFHGAYDRFYADPIALAQGDVHAVFMEEYPYSLGRGVIACAVLGADGTLGAPREILRKPYHLSYPFVFRDGDTVYMIPESSGNGTVDLYRCTAFPFEWTHQCTLLSDSRLTDATVHFDGTRWWMFGTLGEQGAYAWDERHLYMADSIAGPWTPHPQNPVKCDSRSARPAGPLFRRGDQLLRPTQDCSESYGGAVNLCAIDCLSPTEFGEHVVGRLAPELFPGTNGLHTLASTDALEVVDVRPRRRHRLER